MTAAGPVVLAPAGDDEHEPGDEWRRCHHYHPVHEQHKIAEAIRMSDPKAAAAAMRRHVQTVSKVRLLNWNPDDEG